MPVVQIENAEISALITFVTARQPAGPVINGLLQRLQALATIAVKTIARDLYAACLDGTVAQAQIDLALASGVPQGQINKILAATGATVV